MDEEKVSYKNPLAGLNLEGIQDLLKEKLSTLPHGYKLPYMQWYEDDFKSSDGVEELSPLARLMYRQLLAKAWVAKEAPFLPADKDRLMRLADCPDEESWKRYGGEVLGMFTKTKDKKRMFHPRQLLDYTSQIVRISANTNNGKKGGRPPKPKKTKEEDKTQTETHYKPEENPVKRQSESEPESTSETKTEQKTITDFQTNFDFDGQEENMKLKDELTKIAAQYGEKAGGYKTDWDNVKILGIAHGTGAVSRDFEEWIGENAGDDFPKGAVVAYLRTAEDRLRAETPSVSSAKDPEVVSLTRELSYLSGGVVAFLDKQRTRLAEVLKEFSAEEIKAAFKIWLEEHDLNDPFTLKGAANNFTQTADQLCYSAQRRKLESEAAKVQRNETAKRLQEEAESERRKKEAEKLKESELFDPLA